MSYWKEYVYVDAHYDHPVTKTRMKWQRVRVNQVDKIIAKAHGANVLCTVQRFKDAVRPGADKEEEPKKPAKANGHDPAAQAELERIKEADTCPDDKQLHYCGLYFDFDCDPEKFGISSAEAAGRSLEDVRKLLTWAKASFEGLKDPHLQVWYSGSKGFHVTLRPELLGIRPHKHLSYIVKICAEELRQTLDLPTLDLSVYTIPRMWRIANTTHPKTGRYKIELYHEEVLTFTPERLIELAKGPRGTSDHPLPNSYLYQDLEYDDLQPDPQLSQWWAERVAVYDAKEDLKRLRPRRPIKRPESGDFPACVHDILENGPKEGCDAPRNRVVLTLTGFFKDAGIEKEEIRDYIDKFQTTHYPGNESKRNERRSNALTIINNAFSPNTQIRFSCHFIRSLSGKGDGNKVACVGEPNCAWVQDPKDQEPERIPLVHLSQAAKGCYVGTKVRTEIHIASVAKTPYEVPIKGRVLCTPDAEADICKRCPNNWDGGKGAMEYELGVGDRVLLELIDVNDSLKKSSLKRRLGIPDKCYRHKFEPIAYTNMEELQVIPMVDHAKNFQIDEDSDQAVKNDRHVVGHAFYLGHGMEPNKKYRVEASVWGHPRNQRGVLVFEKAEPAQDDISQFKMTEELYDKLKIFRPMAGQTVEQKMKDIHTDLTANVHQIGGREALSMAVDLCYHSVLGFRFDGQDIQKGWFELLVCGDSATGKSTMVSRLMGYYGLGEMIAGEVASRTGLVYASVQIRGEWSIQWGKIPANDTRLLVIDEFSGIPQEEVKNMTQIRSEGRAKGGGVVKDHETWARTRMILLTNPANNFGMMQGFTFGIEAINGLFKEKADLRRVDLALIVDRNEVSAAMLNKRWSQTEVPSVYTANLCQSLILWAWSRNPSQVKFQPGAEDHILARAAELGDVYDCDILLAEKADLRLKIARIACAVAARMFSSDEEGKKLLVSKEHVDFAATFMDRSYRAKAMNYFAYAKKWKQDNRPTQQQREEFGKALRTFQNYDNIVTTLLEMDYFQKRDLIEQLDMSKEEFDRLWWKVLMRWRLVNRGTNNKGYKKTDAFTEFLKGLGNRALGFGDDQPHRDDPPPSEPPRHWSDPDDVFTDDPGGQEPPF